MVYHDQQELDLPEFTKEDLKLAQNVSWWSGLITGALCVVFATAGWYMTMASPIAKACFNLFVK